MAKNTDMGNASPALSRLRSPVRRRARWPLLLGLLWWTACSLDPGIEPQIGVPVIRGTVTFAGDPPSNTDWVVVVAARDFPPTDVVELALAQSQRLDFKAGSADYEIEVPGLGSYAAVAVVWKAKNEPVVWSDVLGLYGASPGAV
ncbi:MAG: hypothetical protein QGH25_05825, partial [Candidatus Latescibacteria bacterium]|nr:hypothetical protein [Candidatus Latescibacterota bacterium]